MTQKTIKIMYCVGCGKTDVTAKLFTDADGHTKSRHTCGYERFIIPAIYDAARDDARASDADGFGVDDDD